MTIASEALLAALRARAVARNKVRDEQRRNSKTGTHPPNDRLASWKAYQLSEANLVEALIVWEIEEGVGD